MKEVGNVSSKYFFEPNKFDTDYKEKLAEYDRMKNTIKSDLKTMLGTCPGNIEESYRMIIESLVELKKEYRL